MINPSVAASSHPPTGQKLGYDATLAALTIATMPAFRAAGSSGQAVATVPNIPRSPKGFPWRTSPRTPPNGLARFDPPNPPYMHYTSEIACLSEFGQCTSVFSPFKNGETETPGGDSRGLHV